MKIRGLCVLVCLPLSLWIGSVGCNAEDEPDFDDIESEEEVGETQQAILGDMDCASSSSKDFVTYSWTTCDLKDHDICSYTTGTNNYGDDWTSGELCQEYLVVEVNTRNHAGGGVTMNVNGFASCYFAGSVPTTQSTCEATHAEVAQYNWDTNSSSWELGATNTTNGQWNGSSCVVPSASASDWVNCTSPGTCEHSPVIAGRCYRVVPGFGPPEVYRVNVGAARLD